MSNDTFVSALRQGDVVAVRRMIEQTEADANMKVEIAREQLQPIRLYGMISIPALHAASVFGRADIVKLLLKHHAHVNARTGTQRGEAPLMLALERSFFQVADVLLQGGADANLADHDGKTPLDCCCRAAGAHYIPTVLRYGAHIEGSEEARQTPLHIACRSGDLLSASILVGHGANVNACGFLGKSPIFQTSPDIMRMLIANGAQVNVSDNDGWTPLHRWAQTDKPLCCELLLSNNANIEAATDRGLTPLRLAVLNDRFEIVCLLLTHQRSLRGCDGVASLLLKQTPEFDFNVLHSAQTARTARFLVEQCRGEDGIMSAVCHQLMFARDVYGKTPQQKARRRNKSAVAEYLESFMNLTLATSATASHDDCMMAVMLNPMLDDFQRAIATDCVDLIHTTCLDVPAGALYIMLGYLSPSDVMKRRGCITMVLAHTLYVEANI